MIFDETLQYDKPISENFDDLHVEVQNCIHWVGKNKKVLEIGCHTGRYSHWIKKNGCIITGVELNANAIEIAKQYLDKACIGDIENKEIRQIISVEKYDVIVIMHVLEHLINPWETLLFLKSLLNDNGVIIIGLPNISNMYNRMEIFAGHFNYQSEGVMDKTHLRFFNQDTARELIEFAGLSITEYFCPSTTEPFKNIINYIPVLRNINKMVNWNGKPLFHFNANSTDIVMNFKCIVAN